MVQLSTAHLPLKNSSGWSRFADFDLAVAVGVQDFGQIDPGGGFDAFEERRRQLADLAEDAGQAAAVAMAKSLGVETIALPTAGNAGGANRGAGGLG